MIDAGNRNSTSFSSIFYFLFSKFLLSPGYSLFYSVFTLLYFTILYFAFVFLPGCESVQKDVKLCRFPRVNTPFFLSLSLFFFFCASNCNLKFFFILLITPKLRQRHRLRQRLQLRPHHNSIAHNSYLQAVCSLPIFSFLFFFFVFLYLSLSLYIYICIYKCKRSKLVIRH